jgi:hypothetical protein
VKSDGGYRIAGASNVGDISAAKIDSHQSNGWGQKRTICTGGASGHQGLSSVPTVIAEDRMNTIYDRRTGAFKDGDWVLCDTIARQR